MKVLSFTMKGRFAHFCAPYTNVYRLTQPCPTKTAIMGFVGSVLGIAKDDLDLYRKIKCGVEMCSEYRTISAPYLTRQGFSGSTDNNKASRTSVEVIVNPNFRVYLAGDNEMLFRIQQLMVRQEPVFTPYLGLAQFIASTEYNVSEIENGEAMESIDKIDAHGAFISDWHGELDFEKINEISTESRLRITEFEGLKNINEPRDFDHAVFTVNIDGGTVPLKNVRNVLNITAWNKNVPIF